MLHTLIRSCTAAYLLLMAVYYTINETPEFTAQEAGALNKLEEFDVAFNPLGDSADTSLAVLLHKCPHLVTLNLNSCSLTADLFLRRKQFTEALKGEKIPEHCRMKHAKFLGLLTLFQTNQ